ncbi:MAG: hypothetical protein ACRD8U_10370, partial [Pyrinomonadaceae bacterium]
MTSQVVKLEESIYQTAFQLLQRRTAKAGADWLNRLRETAMDRFEEMGFPSVKEEEWKYTNVAPISRIAFDVSPPHEINATLTEGEVSKLGYAEAETSRLVIEKGILRSDLSSLVGLPVVVAIDLAD